MFSPEHCAFESGDTLRVLPLPLHGAEIETYHDLTGWRCALPRSDWSPRNPHSKPSLRQENLSRFFFRSWRLHPKWHWCGTSLTSATGASLNVADSFCRLNEFTFSYRHRWNQVQRQKARIPTLIADALGFVYVDTRCDVPNTRLGIASRNDRCSF